nr:hypothetical protein JVH1_7033 [Rhodococcus sp. JVH1]
MLVWVALSVPLAIQIGKAARRKDLHAHRMPRNEKREGDRPDRTAA